MTEETSVAVEAVESEGGVLAEAAISAKNCVLAACFWASES